MNRNTHLFNLHSIFNLFAPCWNDWKAYAHNGLGATDIYVLDNLKQSNFEVDAGNGQMFYYQPKVIEGVTAKLHSNYTHYQEWVVLKFWFTLLKRFDKSLIDFYFELPLASLPLTHTETELLKKFNVKNIEQLINEYPDKEMHKPELFGLVMQWMSINLKREPNPHNEIALIPNGSIAPQRWN